MRIGIYDPYLDDLGGGEKYMMTIAECLSVDNTVIVFWNNKTDLKKVADRFSLDLSKITIKENIFSNQYPFLKRCLESLGYDALIILSDGSVPFVLSKKLFIHFQQPLPLIKKSFKNNLKNKRVNSFFCNSFFTKSYIDKEFQIESKVIYPPSNMILGKSQKENIILHVGRFRAINVGVEDYKKQGLMIGVFKKMVDRGLKNWKFILAIGVRDEDKQKIDQLKNRIGKYPIELLVNLDNKSLGKIYLKSKIYWHASGYGEDLDKKPELAEHFGISTVEAMSAGSVPVVISAGGQKEIVENGKNGYLWNNLDDLVLKTSKLISDEKFLGKMSINAIERSKIFEKNKFCQNIRKLVLLR